jgi:hypothetical protein
MSEMPEHHYSKSVLPLHEESQGKWLDKARVWAQQRAREKGEVCADDVWFGCPPPPDVDRRVLGGVFQPRDLWEVVRYKPSIRRSCHGRPIAVHKLRKP